MMMDIFQSFLGFSFNYVYVCVFERVGSVGEGVGGSYELANMGTRN